MRKGEVITESAIITASAWEPIVSALTAQISVSTVMAAIGSVAAVCIGLVFAWWGVRKVTRMIMGAFRKGRINP